MPLPLLLLFACSDGFGLGARAAKPTDADTDSDADSDADADADSDADSDADADTDAMDADGDGSDATADCNDDDASVFPGAAEVCDGVDQDCDGDPDGDSCGIWTLTAGTETWDAWPLDASGSAHAPAAAIEEAVAVEETGRVWVLTRSTWHVLLLDGLQWIDSGDRDTLFPEVAGLEITAAASVPAGWAADPTPTSADVYIQTADTLWLYSFDLGTRVFTRVSSTPVEWPDDPLAPSAPAITLGWLAVDETAGWASVGDPRATCGLGDGTMGPYLVYMTSAGKVHLYDAGWCFQFVARIPALDFSVFTFAASPDPMELGGADWTGQQLIAFR